MLLKENLSYLITKFRLKQKDLASILDVKTSVAANYTNGRSLPKYEGLILLSEHFKISCDDLLKKDLSKHREAENKESDNQIVNRLIDIIEEKDKQITKLIEKL